MSILNKIQELLGAAGDVGKGIEKVQAPVASLGSGILGMINHPAPVDAKLLYTGVASPNRGIRFAADENIQGINPAGNPQGAQGFPAVRPEEDDPGIQGSWPDLQLTRYGIQGGNSALVNAHSLWNPYAFENADQPLLPRSENWLQYPTKQQQQMLNNRKPPLTGI